MIGLAVDNMPFQAAQALQAAARECHQVDPGYGDAITPGMATKVLWVFPGVCMRSAHPHRYVHLPW